MEPGGSMPHSQGLSNNSYPEPNQEILIGTEFREIAFQLEHFTYPQVRGGPPFFF